MGFFDSKSKSSTKSETTVIDTAENFERANAETIYNINLAGASVGNASGKGSRIGSDQVSASKLGIAGKDGGADGMNTGLQLNFSDNGAIDKAFGFAQLSLAASGATSEKAISSLSRQLSEKRNADDAALIDTQNLRANVLMGLGVLAAVFAVTKIWGKG